MLNDFRKEEIMRQYEVKFKEGTLTSEKAEAGAQRLINRLRSGDLKKEVLPNTYEVFSGDLEDEDYRSFCRFLKSHNGKSVIDMIERKEGISNVGF